VITLKKLKWDNCFSYGSDNELDLSSDIVTQLVGTNGTGKSSIPLILEEVLFNKNSKGIKKADIPNREVNNGYDISLTFDVVDDQYEIDVVRRANIKVKLYKNGEDISSHTATNTYKTLEQIIGIDFKTFSQIVYQNTNASLQFLTATDTNRKRFLIDLLQLDDYVKYFEVFKELSRTLGGDVSRIQGKIDTIIKWLNDNKLEDTSLLPKLDLPFYSEEDEESLRSLQIEMENISEITKKINQNNLYKSQLESIDIGLAKEFLSMNDYEDTSDLKQSLGELTSRASLENKMIKKYTDLQEMDQGRCPTCEQPVDYEFISTQLRNHISEKNSFVERIDAVKNSISRIENTNNTFTQMKEKVDNYEDLLRSVDMTLANEVPNSNELQEKIEKIKGRIRDRKSRVEEIIAENEKRERHNTRLSIIQEQQTDFENQLDELSASIGEIEDKLSHVEILKKAFSTNGLLAYKIENLVKDLEVLTNEYLAELSDGRFSLEFVVLNDKLNVEIDDNGKKVDILALSAGELARVNTSTLLAIRKLMSSISKSRINVLFLDEVTNVLDELGKERMVEILLREENLNTYIVSHGWTHPLLSKIEVIKEDKISRLDGQS
jgi:DNA repair exonuclease SbcCD ATPase subunit|tara:strand:- start:1671 stop:3491 length:1821 start_codon:yes stop_codon:yes gene_type:complete